MIASKSRALLLTFRRQGGFAVSAVSQRSVLIPPPNHAAQTLPSSFSQQQKQISQTLRSASTVRRRRGGAIESVRQQSDDDDDRRAPHVAVKDSALFQQEADKLLLKLDAALRPMEKHNDVFNLILTPRNHYSSGSLTLELKPEDGSYRIEVNDEAKKVHMTTAISGHYSYVLSASTGEWVDEEDGHSMEGMLVRDLIRQCNGLPDL